MPLSVAAPKEERMMLHRVFGHMRQNVVAYIALFVALGGASASAANTVFSSDIVDGEVKSVDIGDSEVQSADVANGTLQAQDYGIGSVSGARIQDNNVTTLDLADNAIFGSDVAAGTLNGSDVADGSLTGADVATNSLTGSDIDESTFVGLDGDVGHQEFAGLTGTPSDAFIDFPLNNPPTVTLNNRARVLVSAMTHSERFGTSTGAARGSCRLERNEAVVSFNHGIGEFTNFDRTTMQLTDVQALDPGAYTFELSCNRTTGEIAYVNTHISVVELSLD
jgi:hypothetical protein